MSKLDEIQPSELVSKTYRTTSCRTTPLIRLIVLLLSLVIPQCSIQILRQSLHVNEQLLDSLPPEHLLLGSERLCNIFLLESALHRLSFLLQ